MNEIIVKWGQIYRKGITLSASATINTLRIADDQVIIADAEDNSRCKTYRKIMEWKYHQKDLRLWHFRTRPSKM